MFWMIAANYFGAEIPSAAPMATIGALLLLTNIACLFMLGRRVLSSSGPALACSNSRDHEFLDHPGRFPDMGVRDDVAGRPSRLGDYLYERETRRSIFGLPHDTRPRVMRDAND